MHRSWRVAVVVACDACGATTSGILAFEARDRLGRERAGARAARGRNARLPHGTVHVAHALTAGTPVDEDYLASVSMLHRLDEWRQLAGGILAA